jgi:hypothetical protein
LNKNRKLKSFAGSKSEFNGEDDSKGIDEDYMSADSDLIEYSGSNMVFNVGPSRNWISTQMQNVSFFQRIIMWFKGWFEAIEEKSPRKLSIEEFFSSVKNTAEELVIIKERVLGYEKAMVNAKQSGQKALYEQLQGGLNAHRMETQLFAQGFQKFMKEEKNYWQRNKFAIF